MTIRKKVFWSLLSLLLAGMAIWGVLAQLGEMPLRQLWESIRESRKIYLFAACLCGGLFIILEGEAIRRILSGLGYRVSFRHGVLYSADGKVQSLGLTAAAVGTAASALAAGTFSCPKV